MAIKITISSDHEGNPREVLAALAPFTARKGTRIKQPESRDGFYRIYITIPNTTKEEQ